MKKQSQLIVATAAISLLTACGPSTSVVTQTNITQVGGSQPITQASQNFRTTVYQPGYFSWGYYRPPVYGPVSVPLMYNY